MPTKKPTVWARSLAARAARFRSTEVRVSVNHDDAYHTPSPHVPAPRERSEDKVKARSKSGRKRRNQGFSLELGVRSPFFLRLLTTVRRKETTRGASRPMAP